jgi:hypothetical protein
MLKLADYQSTTWRSLVHVTSIVLGGDAKERWRVASTRALLPHPCETISCIVLLIEEYLIVAPFVSHSSSVFQLFHRNFDMHVDTAPWTSWLRIAVPLLQCLIFLTTVTVIALGAASSAVIERQWDLQYLEQTDQTSLPETSYTSTHEMKVRM